LTDLLAFLFGARAVVACRVESVDWVPFLAQILPHHVILGHFQMQSSLLQMNHRSDETS
jgi:hypothetical protein